MVTYNLGIGLWKTLKNGLILLGPAIVAFMLNVPEQYAWIAGPILYVFKNWLENHK